MAPRVPLSDNENLLVGIVGGCTETAVLMPVITAKLCAQEGRPYPAFPGMYRGAAVLTSSVAPITALQMVANGIFERMTTGGTRKATDLEVVGCALGAGATSAIVYAPVDLTMSNAAVTFKHLTQRERGRERERERERERK